MSAHTLADIGLWCRDLSRLGTAGLPREILDWLQHHLQGRLYRVGNHEFEPVPLPLTLAAFREHATGRVVALAAEGLERDAGGGGRGHPLDDRAGRFLDGVLELPSPAWSCVLEPGAPMLELHTPSDARLGERHSLDSIAQALAFFSRLRPDLRPRGIWGKGWFLDPLARELLPRNRGIHWIQDVTHLFPFDIPEERTVRRFFGPGVSRADLPALDPEHLDPLQRRLVALLANPARTLVGRGTFMTREELARLERRRAARVATR